MKIEFKTDNQAFQDGNEPTEIQRILKQISAEIDYGFISNFIKDVNGNRIGTWEI